MRYPTNLNWFVEITAAEGSHARFARKPAHAPGFRAVPFPVNGGAQGESGGGKDCDAPRRIGGTCSGRHPHRARRRKRGQGGNPAALPPGDTAPPDALANIPNPSETGPGDPKRKVIFVGNNWEGTADVISTHGGKFKTLTRINIVPDYDERVDEICGNPVDLAYFIAIRELVGEGNDQLVDDMYSTPDGKLLVVSRPSFRDVVAIHLTGPDTGDIAWRFQVAGQRSDHMAISPDGKQVAVSASTGNVVHLLNTKTGAEEGTFASGDSPTRTPTRKTARRSTTPRSAWSTPRETTPIFDTNTNKGDRYFQVVDADTHEIISQVDMGQKLEEAGYPDMSSAVRPMAITSNERKAFLQVSFFHGVVSYDLKKEKVKRVTRLPNLDPERPSRAVPPRLGAPRHRACRQRQAPLHRRDDVVVCHGDQAPPAPQGIARSEADPEGRKALLVDHL